MYRQLLSLIVATLTLLLIIPVGAPAVPTLLIESPPSLEQGESASYLLSATSLQGFAGVSLEVTYDQRDFTFLHTTLFPSLAVGRNAMVSVAREPGTVKMDITLSPLLLDSPDTLRVCRVNFVVLDAEADPPQFEVSTYVGAQLPNPSPKRPGPPTEDSPLPSHLALVQNRPNPFNPDTRISFDLPAPAPVTLDIFDVTGRQVTNILDQALLPAGRHTAHWDGTDREGSTVPSGVYFYRLEAGNWAQTMKMILVR